MRTRSLAPVSVVLSALFFTGCASDISAPDAGSADASNAIRAGERLTGVAIDSAVPALSVGDSVTLRAALVFSRGGTLPGNGVRWVSLTSNVATVAATTGRVVTRAPGAVRVTATFLGKADTLTLTVNAPAAPARTTPQPVDGRPAPSAPVAAAGEPELPRSLVDTRLPAPTGRRLVVRAGDRLQTAIDSARPGDVLLLEAGATFR